MSIVSYHTYNLFSMELSVHCILLSLPIFVITIFHSSKHTSVVFNISMFLWCYVIWRASEMGITFSAIVFCSCHGITYEIKYKKFFDLRTCVYKYHQPTYDIEMIKIIIWYLLLYTMIELGQIKTDNNNFKILRIEENAHRINKNRENQLKSESKKRQECGKKLIRLMDQKNLPIN